MLALLDAPQPNAERSQVLDALRAQLQQAARGRGDLNAAAADEVLRAARNGTLGFQERAALLKTMQHFYMVERKGAQSVWVADPPHSYNAWPYDLFANKSADVLKPLLQHADERFGPSVREMMADAVQLARKWCADVYCKTSAGGAVLKDIRRWFHLPDADADAAERTRQQLVDGFRRMMEACNQNAIVFADHAALRNSGEWDNSYAAVCHDDRLLVIYIFEPFIESSYKRPSMRSIPPLWACAVTIIHELSHKLLRTEDFRYEHDGLKPAKFDRGAPIRNAESWAYFAAAAVGALHPAALNRIC